MHVEGVDEYSGTAAAQIAADKTNIVRDGLLSYGHSVREAQFNRVYTRTAKFVTPAGDTITKYVASVQGSITVDTDTVDAVLNALVTWGADIDGVHWGIDPAHPAHRQTRKDAVAVARIAAEDFADAAGMKLGPLVSLSDPGTGHGSGRGAEPGGPFSAALADVSVDVTNVTVTATVEAVYLLTAAH